MKIRFQKGLPVLLFALLVSAPTLASLPQVEAAWTGVKDVCDKQGFGLHILRKALLVGLASQQGTQNPVRLDGRIVSAGGVWKTQGSSLTACCGSHGRDSNLNRDNKRGLTVRPELVEGWAVKPFMVRQAHHERLNLILSHLKPVAHIFKGYQSSLIDTG